ncbi:MAG: nitroreductase/quinone reductase family protein [Acidimicrobiales bacterium]
MTDTTTRPEPSDFNRQVIEALRASGGVLSEGPFAGAPLLVLHTTGRRSGRTYEHPMMYLELDGRVYVFASRAGHAEHPDWYLNLVAHPAVTVERDGETYPARAVVLNDDDRTRVYALQSDLYPQFAEYQRQTSRVIPVVELVRAD